MTLTACMNRLGNKERDVLSCHLDLHNVGEPNHPPFSQTHVHRTPPTSFFLLSQLENFFEPPILWDRNGSRRQVEFRDQEVFQEGFFGMIDIAQMENKEDGTMGIGWNLA